jgi:hypothetical protein
MGGAQPTQATAEIDYFPHLVESTGARPLHHLRATVCSKAFHIKDFAAVLINNPEKPAGRWLRGLGCIFGEFLCIRRQRFVSPSGQCLVHLSQVGGNRCAFRDRICLLESICLHIERGEIFDKISWPMA